jgi:arylsulfatase A-like enzyme
MIEGMIKRRCRSGVEFLRAVVWAIVCIGAIGGGVACIAAERPPNFIVIFIDDLGYADVSPFGGARHDTPHLERMAREGRKFTNFYVASSVCTPSRAAIMTGCYPARVDMLHNDLQMESVNHSVLWPGDRKGLNPKEVTIAEALKARGYATACIGKWHLGDQPAYLPTRQGFDEFFGIPNGHDMSVGAKPFGVPPPMVQNETVMEELDRDDFGFLTKRYTDYALGFIERNAERPFFIYLPHNMVHGPHYASPAFDGKTGKGLYADVVAEVDWSVGRILDHLVELNLDERTLVLFTSDNGSGLFELKPNRKPKPGMPLRYASNSPFSGGKATPAEGGFRVPTIAWWPGTIEAGSETGLMASVIDLLPTFASLAGEPFVAKAPIDGVDVSGLFGERLPADSPRNTFVYYGYFNPANQYRETDEVLLHAVREGRWKYYVKPTRFLEVGTESYLEISAGALFDLVDDPAETRDVSKNHPDAVARLKELARKYVRELGDEGRAGIGVRKAAMADEAWPMNYAR